MRPLRCRKGNMPFAVIAVTILLIAGAYASVTAYVDRAQDNIDNIGTELEAFDDTVDDVGRMVNQGMGEIISDLSRRDSGSLVERCGEFERLAEEWMSFQFPMTDGAVTVKLDSYNVILSAESLRSVGEEMSSKPMFLRASGYADVAVTSASGSSCETLSISADGASALPFILGQSSLFELAVNGERSMLTQLISYQLNSLVQFRAIQGYGSASQYGAFGTESMLTEKDVMQAYENSMSAIKTMFFRTTDGVPFTDGSERVDLAELLVSPDGAVDIDMTAIFAQAISSKIDELVLKWTDYFMGDKLLDIVDSLLDVAIGLGEKAYNLLVGLKNLFSKTQTPQITASNHLMDAMRNAGYPESEYRRLLNGPMTITYPGGEYAVGDDEETLIALPSSTINVDGTDRDVVSWGGWNSFLGDYRKETNAVKSAIHGVLSAICYSLSSEHGRNAVHVSMDAHDTESFTSSLMSAVTSAITEQSEMIDEKVDTTMSAVTFTDPMYGAMFKRIETSSDELFGTSRIRGAIEERISNSIDSWISSDHDGILLDGDLRRRMIDDQMESEEVKRAIADYEKKAEERVALFNDVLNSVSDRTGAAKQILALIIKKGLVSIDVVPDVKGMIVPLCEEMIQHINMNSLDVLDLPGKEEFVVTDHRGNEYTELISLTSSDELNIQISSPTSGGDNVHYTDDLLGNGRKAAYSALFTVRISSNMSFTASSYSSVSKMFGIQDSVYSGTVNIDTEMSVPVMTSWALAGVDYTPSRTVIDDIEKIVRDVLIPVLKKILDPLLEPLRELWRMADSVFNMVGSVMVEASAYITSMIEELYEKIAGPMERIQEMLSSFKDIFGEGFEEIIKIGLGSQEFGFRYYEFELKITTNVKEAYLNHTTVLKVEMSMPVKSVDLHAAIEIKRNDKKEYTFACTASAKADDWNITVVADPFMKMKRHMVELNGLIRNTEIHAVIPEMVQYDEMEFRVSDIPGIGTILSNIPLPIPGVKGTLDAGVELKYNLPFKNGLMINEFESNPEGTDAGKEWIELYNSSSNAIDLSGYRLVMESADGKYHNIGKKTIGPGEFLVIKLQKQMLNNSFGAKGYGECIVLVDPDGNETDRTHWRSDTDNDGKTWQRKYDGCLDWTLRQGTCGETNGGKLFNDSGMRSMIRQCFIDAAIDAFGKIRSIDDILGVSDLLKTVIENAIKKVMESIAACVVEASVFFEIKTTDYTGAAGAGIRLSVVIGQEIIEKGLKWIVNEIAGVALNIGNPAGLDPKTILSDDVHIRFTAFTGLSLPKFLDSFSGVDNEVAVIIQSNISAVCTLLGKETGTWNVTAGVMLEDVPAAMVPKMFKIDRSKNTDIWLMRCEFRRVSV